MQLSGNSLFFVARFNQHAVQLADREIADNRRRNAAQTSENINNAQKVDAFTMEKIFVFFQGKRLTETLFFCRKTHAENFFRFLQQLNTIIAGNPQILFQPGIFIDYFTSTS